LHAVVQRLKVELMSRMQEAQLYVRPGHGLPRLVIEQPRHRGTVFGPRGDSRQVVPPGSFRIPPDKRLKKHVLLAELGTQQARGRARFSPVRAPLLPE
jgi:hypothetical protein